MILIQFFECQISYGNFDNLRHFETNFLQRARIWSNKIWSVKFWTKTSTKGRTFNWNFHKVSDVEKKFTTPLFLKEGKCIQSCCELFYSLKTAYFQRRQILKFFFSNTQRSNRFISGEQFFFVFLLFLQKAWFWIRFCTIFLISKYIY